MARPPLNRRMFRVPGMSRQPMGILASGPQIMDAAMRSTNQNPFMMGDNPVMARQVSTANQVVVPPVSTSAIEGAPAMNSAAFNQLDRDLMGSLSAADAEAMLSSQFDALGGPSPTDAAARKGANLAKEATASVMDTINAKNKELLAREAANKKPDRLGDFQSQLRKNIDGYRAALDKAEAPSLNSPIAALAGKSYNELVNEFITEGDTDIPSIADYKLSDFQDLAMQVTGRDRDPSEVADEDRQTSFWLNLMKAGLAIASGESSDALTNIAKGLSFGLESYGKDMKDITQQERDANKEIAGIKFALLKDQKDADVAQRAAKIQALQTRVAIADKLNAQELAAFDKKQARALEMLKVENDFIVKSNEMGLKLDELDFNREKFGQTVKATLAGQTPTFIRELAAAGYVAATDEKKGVDFADPNSYTLTEEGDALFRAYVESKGSVRLTDLMESANAASDLGMAYGASFSHLPEAEAKKAAKTLTLAMGKLKIPTTEPEASAAKLPYFRQTNARTSDGNMIQYVLENNVPGVTFHGPSGEVLSQDNLDLLKSRNKKASATPIQYIQFKSRILAERE
jgi:hypothetical protein